MQLNILRTGIFAFILALFFVSCKDDCADIVCNNGGVCVDGTCECAEGWTGSDCSTPVNAQSETISGTYTDDLTLTSSSIWTLEGRLVIEDGATLTIEPGTIIKAKQGTAANASVIVIARGGKIEACGTAANPIIMTSELDNIELGEVSGSSLGAADNELWGGLVILGNAPISANGTTGEANIEGFEASEDFVTYGGTNENDNSGSLCYVSVRHGGTQFLDDNEINGITLAGVGAGTTINNIEVVANFDDGIEFFGGNVDVQNLVIAFQGDDGIDIDQAYSGTVDNFYVVHGDGTDFALEIDGPEGTTNENGKFTLTNGECRSNGGAVDGGATFKSRAQGTVSNVFFTNYSEDWIRVRDSFDPDAACADKIDAYDNFLIGDLSFSNIEFETADFTLDQIATAYTDDDDCAGNIDGATEAALDAGVANGNSVVGVGASTVGPDKTVFEGWSWTSANNWL